MISCFITPPVPGVPSLPAFETWFSRFGDMASMLSCSLSTCRYWGPAHAGPRPGPGDAGENGQRMLSWGDGMSRNPPCWVGFRFSVFALAFLFVFGFVFTSYPNSGIMRHVLFNVMQWTYTKIHSSVKCTVFFNAVYSPVNNLCKWI